MLPPFDAERPCARSAIDSRIEHYRQLGRSVVDQQTLNGIAELIRRMSAEKVALSCGSGVVHTQMLELNTKSPMPS